MKYIFFSFCCFTPALNMVWLNIRGKKKVEQKQEKKPSRLLFFKRKLWLHVKVWSVLTLYFCSDNSRARHLGWFPLEIIIMMHLHVGKEQLSRIANLLGSTQTLCGYNKYVVCILCVVMKYEQQASPLFLCFHGECLRLLMKCKPLWMETQWGVEWALSILPLAIYFYFCGSFFPLSFVHLNLSCSLSFVELQ